jgi:hypothetical protein
VVKVFRVAVGSYYEFSFIIIIIIIIWEDKNEINFFAIVAEVFVYPKADVFLVFWGFVDEVFDGLIVVLEPVPESIDFSHDGKI